MEESTEIAVKYQKLAHEYSKLKAQNTVLKNAISEEQTSVSDLQDALKKKDQLVRKLEQEVECLNFRNLQLSKRVSILQNDLENVDSSTKHQKGKHTSNSALPLSESYNILNTELQSRIEENERLSQQLFAAESEYEKKVSELSSTIDSLESRLAQQEKKFSEQIKQQEEQIGNLQKEKIKMQVSLKKLEQETKERNHCEETRVKDVIVANKELTLQLEKAKRTIADKVIFNDKSRDAFNSLNVPLIERGRHQRVVKAMLKVQGFVADLSRHLSELHSFMLQRLCTEGSGSKLSDVVPKLEHYLRECIIQLKPLSPAFEKITLAIKTETIAFDKASLVKFSEAFKKYEAAVDVLLPYLLLRIENTDSWSNSSPKLAELVPRLVLASKKLVATLKKLATHLVLLAELGSSKDKFCINPTEVIEKIASDVDTLQKCFEESRQLFSAKKTLYHQLPIVTNEEKSTDECILATLVSLSATLKKITELIDKESEVLSFGVWYKSKHSSKDRNVTLHPCVWLFKERGRQYMEHVTQQPEPPSIPYEEALKNYQTLCENSDNQENLTQQLEEYQKKLMQLELDKENWMLECQLMRAKISKNGDSESSESVSLPQDYEEIHRHVKTTVNQLVQQVQLADSKAITFKSECENLYQRLKLSLQRKEALEDELSSSRKLIDQLKEEQKTLKSSYDEQMNTMSEHLASLNDTLAAQKEEIDTLKQHGKGLKKGRSK